MSTKMAKRVFSEKLELPEGVKAALEPGSIVFTGEKGTVRQRLSRKVKVSLEGSGINLSCRGSKKDKAVINTYKILFRNCSEGVKNGFTYKLKVCSSHFPVTLAVAGNTLQIKNLLGEKVPRQLRIKEGITVTVDSGVVTVSGIDKAKVGQVAADIEQASRRQGFDRRVFQDGIYITEKAGRVV